MTVLVAARRQVALAGIAENRDHGLSLRQVWMLNGGPGASSADFEALAEPLLDRVEGASLYLLDHRGVGRSARLGCPEEEDENSVGGPGIAPDEWPSCIDALEAQWGTDLRHFSTTQAALDLDNLIAATRDGYEHVHVWGAPTAPIGRSATCASSPSSPTRRPSPASCRPTPMAAPTTAPPGSGRAARAPRRRRGGSPSRLPPRASPGESLGAVFGAAFDVRYRS